jgi:hypothetical protein
MAEDAATPILHKRTGRVTTLDGKPIAVVIVQVVDVDARFDEGQICPSAFPGVGKRYLTDGDGKYELVDLHPQLKYRIWISAAGYKSELREDESGGATKPLIVKLTPQVASPAAADVLGGQILGGDGKPVAGAVFRIIAEIKGRGDDQHEEFGELKNADRYFASDGEGRFMAVAEGNHRRFFVKVMAAGFASQTVQMATGADKPDENDVTLSRGCSITGRLVKDGKPLPGVMMLMSHMTADTAHTAMFGVESVGTDIDGKFTFEHLPENEEGSVIAAFESIGSRGATNPSKLKTGAVTGAATDLGDMKVGPAVTLSVRCLLPEGVDSAKGLQVLIAPLDCLNHEYF